MPAELFRRDWLHAAAPPRTLDPAFAARPRLLALRAALCAARDQLRRPGWNEPPVFFFDPRRQAELDAARPHRPEPLGEVADAVRAELPHLLAHAEVRHAARAIEGLRGAAAALAPRCPAARDLADLLAVPDDEVFLVLDPGERTGVRLHLRGLCDVGQLVAVLEPLRRGPVQLFAPAALRADGSLPAGVGGCGHWLWPAQPLAAVPRAGGERVVLMGAASARADAEPRFPGLVTAVELVQTLRPLQVLEELSKRTGVPVPAAPPVPAPPVARAA